MLVTALIIGILAIVSRPREGAKLIANERMDPQQAAFDEARQTMIRDLPAPATAKFSDPATDNNTGAAEIGNGIWEAWGKVDYRDAAGAMIHTDWHVAWDRKTKRVIYRKLGSRETGNYAEALGASKAYPVGPDAAD